MSEKTLDYSLIPDQDRAQRLATQHAQQKENRRQEKELHRFLGLNYRYFRFFYRGREVSVAVGYKVTDRRVEYAVAFQSASDAFSRIEARRRINRRWDAGYKLSFINAFDTKDVEWLIALHYNAQKLKSVYGVGVVPKYLHYIPIGIAGPRDAFEALEIEINRQYQQRIRIKRERKAQRRSKGEGLLV